MTVAGETEVLGENLPLSALFTTNPISPDLGSSPGRWKPVTNRLSYGTAYEIDNFVITIYLLMMVL
jgi:hypothetical protein